MRTNNPYPGLKPFSEDDSLFFFGRDEQINAVIKKIQASYFIAVVGSSGSGKSSLIKAGLIPQLAIKTNSDWKIARMRPGKSPIKNLAASLQAVTNKSIEDILLILRKSKIGLLKILAEANADSNNRIFLLVDQFEELFTYREEISDTSNTQEKEYYDEVIRFVALLTETINAHHEYIRVVITMRSDFIGNCAKFQDFSAILNDNQFLTPKLTRDQYQEAIQKPALIYGGKIDPVLINSLLNDLDKVEFDDQLPVLQHALMYMWDKRITPENRGTGIILNIDDYSRIEGLKDALSKHGNEVYNRLGVKKKIAEIIFKRLTGYKDNKEVRRLATIGEIAAVARVELVDIANVTDEFLSEGVNFIAANGPISNKETLLEITHECLMRQWKILIELMNAERGYAEKYLWLSKFNANLSGIDLSAAKEWKEKSEINIPWALRYDKHAAETVQRISTRLRNSIFWRSVKRACWIGLPIISFIVFSLWSIYSYNQRRQELILATNYSINAYSKGYFPEAFHFYKLTSDSWTNFFKWDSSLRAYQIVTDDLEHRLYIHFYGENISCTERTINVKNGPILKYYSLDNADNSIVSTVHIDTINDGNNYGFSYDGKFLWKSNKTNMKTYQIFLENLEQKRIDTVANIYTPNGVFYYGQNKDTFFVYFNKQSIYRVNIHNRSIESLCLLKVPCDNNCQFAWLTKNQVSGKTSSKEIKNNFYSLKMGDTVYIIDMHLFSQTNIEKIYCNTGYEKIKNNYIVFNYNINTGSINATNHYITDQNIFRDTLLSENCVVNDNISQIYSTVLSDFGKKIDGASHLDTSNDKTLRLGIYNNKKIKLSIADSKGKFVKDTSILENEDSIIAEKICGDYFYVITYKKDTSLAASKTTSDRFNLFVGNKSQSLLKNYYISSPWQFSDFIKSEKGKDFIQFYNQDTHNYGASVLRPNMNEKEYLHDFFIKML